jgi:hypothetical protein
MIILGLIALLFCAVVIGSIHRMVASGEEQGPYVLLAVGAYIGLNLTLIEMFGHYSSPVLM